MDSLRPSWAEIQKFNHAHGPKKGRGRFGHDGIEYKIATKANFFLNGLKYSYQSRNRFSHEKLTDHRLVPDYKLVINN